MSTQDFANKFEKQDKSVRQIMCGKLWLALATNVFAFEKHEIQMSLEQRKQISQLLSWGLMNLHNDMPANKLSNF